MMTRPGPVGTYFDVPNGAFPVPWGPEEECPADGQGLYGGRFIMGQGTPVVCEDTAEGGKRCSDGRYHPPTCGTTPGAPGEVRAEGPSGFPILPLAAGAAAVAAGVALLAGRRMGIAATEAPPYLEDKYPREYAELRKIADSITAERAADAFNFTQYQAAATRRLVAVDQARIAEARLAEEQRRWEQAHQNADALQAAQAEVDRLSAEIAAASEEAAQFRERIEANARNILIHRENAMALIGMIDLEAFRHEARRLIDPCYRPPGGPAPAMRGLKGPVPVGLPARPLGLFRRM